MVICLKIVYLKIANKSKLVFKIFFLVQQNKIKPPPVSQRPPQRQKIVVQRQEPEVPEYLKEMFARKSAQETEREMEEEILKSNHWHIFK